MAQLVTTGHEPVRPVMWTGVLGEGERTKDGVLSDEADAAKVRFSAKKLSARVRDVEDAIAAMNLDGVWNMRPILDGGKVMKLTGAKGPVMKVLTERLIDWQLENPEGGEAEATAFLAKRGPLEFALQLTKDAAFPKRMGKPIHFAIQAISMYENAMMNGGTVRVDAGQRFAPK